MKINFIVFSWIPEGCMVSGYPSEPIGPREYIPQVVISGEDPYYTEFAEIPGARPQENRRKAKRLLNRYRKFRNKYQRITGQPAPFHYY